MGTSQSAGMEGSWASSDGIFVAGFSGGQFTSRARQNNAVLAQGTYSVRGDVVQMDWVSVSTQQQRSATCSFIGPRRVLCQQPGATSFELTRV